jgi:hypothetical protein
VKRYVLMVAYEPWEWSRATEEVRQSFFEAHHAFERFVDEHGARLASGALADADTATSVGHGVGDQRTVSDGPFAETVEQVGGYYDVELPDLDTAIAAARLLPSSYTVEIRPTVRIEGYESV